MSELTERDLAMLAFEARRWELKPAGAKLQAIRDEFGLVEMRYYQLLLHLIARPEALQHSPVLVARLRRLQERPTVRKRIYSCE